MRHDMNDYAWKRLSDYLTRTNDTEGLERLPEVTVYPAHTGRYYGGPEEGGWYYNQTKPIVRSEREFQTMRLDKAIAYCRRANKLCSAICHINRVEFHSVLSEGECSYEWTTGEPVRDPLERPHYE